MASSKQPSGGVGSTADHPLPEPDYDHLDLSFQADEDDNDLKNDLKAKKQPQHYILGTLVVRVVAARNLEPGSQHGGRLGDILTRSSRDRTGTANPYASVRFMHQVQRTSEVHDTLNPNWPHGETMFLDVALPLSRVTHSDVDEKARRAPPVAAAAAATPAAVHQQDIPDDPLPEPTLTVALFHSLPRDKLAGSNERYPTKKVAQNLTGDSDDAFLGMTSVEVTPLLTGKTETLDKWLSVAGTSNANSRASVRVVCEYEPTDASLRPGDIVRFTQFCDRADLFPVPPVQEYRVQEVHGDNVIISYTTPEGWLCTFQAHRYMFVCEERHHGAMEVCQDEIASIAERLGKSPLLSTVSETVDQRLPEEGLLSVGADAVKGGASLLSRWLEGGVETAVGDIVFATNWDGRFNIEHEVESQESLTLIPNESTDGDGVGDPLIASASVTVDDELNDEDDTAEAIPGMPCCPITGEPMGNPVVAADGHTYERKAIARWLRDSNKSPLTGKILPHKELVPNYGLLSSVHEAHQQAEASVSASAALKDDKAYDLEE